MLNCNIKCKLYYVVYKLPKLGHSTHNNYKQLSFQSIKNKYIFILEINKFNTFNIKTISCDNIDQTM